MSSPSSSALTEGQTIQAAAHALAPMTPGGVGPLVQGFAIFYGAVSIAVLCVRVWVRAGFSDASPTRLWGMDDILAVIGTLIFIPAVVFAVFAAQFGVGSHDSDFTSTLYMIRAAEYEVYWEICYFVSSTIIKCSVGATCLRLDPRRRILYPVYANMAVMVITTVLALVFVGLNCQPFAATWNPYLGTCQTQISMTTVSVIVSVIQMASDWTCAIMPFFIVVGLQMSLRKKVAVVAVLGLGIVASICTVIRLPYLKYYDTAAHPTETLYHFGIINILSTTECALATICCSLPPLRMLFMHYFDDTAASSNPHTDDSGPWFRSYDKSMKLDTMSYGHSGHRATAQWAESGHGDADPERNFYGDDSSNDGILVSTDVTVNRSSH